MSFNAQKSQFTAIVKGSKISTKGTLASQDFEKGRGERLQNQKGVAKACARMPLIGLKIIKTHGSESRGQEEAASTRPSRPRSHYSE